MRSGQQKQRGRGRNNNNNGGGGGSGNNNMNNGRKGGNPLSRSYDSTGPDVKIRGTAQHIAEKYATLARDAQSSSDNVMAENYLQHAEHYNRIIAAAQAQMQERYQRDDRDGPYTQQNDRDQNDRDQDDNDQDDGDNQGNQYYGSQGNGGNVQEPNGGGGQMNGRRNERFERPERSDRPDRNGPDRGGQDRNDRPERNERQADRPERSERPPEAQGRDDRAERNEQQRDAQQGRERRPRDQRPPRVERPAEQAVPSAPNVAPVTGTGPQPVIEGTPAEVSMEEEAAVSAARRTPRRKAAAARPRRVRGADGDEAGADGAAGLEPDAAPAATNEDGSPRMAIAIGDV